MFDVFSFYKFKKLISLKKNKVLLQDYLVKKNIRGTVIIASEGVNATISGKPLDLKAAITKIRKILDFKKFDSENSSKSKFQPFHKPKIKIKKEVVPMGLNISAKNKKANYCYESSDHKNIPVCKIYHTNYSINHGVTNRDQAIDGTKRNSVDKLLKKILHIILFY